MYVIGIDPHRGTHAAAVLDGDERVRAVLQLPADQQQRQRLLSWANGFTPRLWAVEGATGTGALLAQQLVALPGRPRLASRNRAQIIRSVAAPERRLGESRRLRRGRLLRSLEISVPTSGLWCRDGRDGRADSPGGFTTLR